jgi:hypothetical protein
MEFSGNQIHIVHEQVSGLLRHDYFDIRLEIVDHILSDIEQKITSDPQLHFFEALNSAIDSFGGRKGVRKLERSKIHESWRTFLLEHFRALIEAFRPPQVFMSVLLLMIIYNVISTVDIKAIWIFLLGCSLTGIMETLESIRMRRKYEVFRISSMPVYTKSAWVTNTPLLFLIFVYHSWFDLGLVPSHIILSLVLFGYGLFFIFKFRFLKKGINEEHQRYKQLHHDLINMPI